MMHTSNYFTRNRRNIKLNALNLIHVNISSLVRNINPPHFAMRYRKRNPFSQRLSDIYKECAYYHVWCIRFVKSSSLIQKYIRKTFFREKQAVNLPFHIASSSNEESRIPHRVCPDTSARLLLRNYEQSLNAVFRLCSALRVCFPLSEQRYASFASKEALPQCQAQGLQRSQTPAVDSRIRSG